MSICRSKLLSLAICLNMASLGAHSQSVSICNQTAVYDSSASGNTQLVPAIAQTKIYICGYTLFAAGTSNVGLTAGTGSNCGTSNSKLTPYYEFTSSTGMSDQSNNYRGLSTPASQALCLYSSATSPVQAIVYYAQF